MGNFGQFLFLNHFGEEGGTKIIHDYPKIYFQKYNLKNSWSQIFGDHGIPKGDALLCKEFRAIFVLSHFNARTDAEGKRFRELASVFPRPSPRTRKTFLLVARVTFVAERGAFSVVDVRGFRRPIFVLVAAGVYFLWAADANIVDGEGSSAAIVVCSRQ